MTKENFIKRLQKELEIESENLKYSTILSDIEEYDSMAVLNLISFLDDTFGIQLTSEQINDITTVNSLIEKIGLEKFQ